MDQTTVEKEIKGQRVLPDNIKSWLASIQLTYLTIELNQKLGFSGEKVTIIPKLLWLLTTGELDPKNFSSELSKQLEISPSAANSLAREIEEKFLRPIEIALRTNFGIDVKLIYFPEAQIGARPQPAAQVPSLIASPEAAHPAETQTAAPSAAAFTTPIPVYRPAPQPAPIPKPAPTMPRIEPLPKPMNTIPKVEPLMASKAESLPPRPTPVPPPIPPRPGQQAPEGRPASTPIRSSVPQEAPVPFKVEPSRVPKFPEPPKS